VTVGFHAPLPPARTGVADYAAVLLEALRRLGDVRPGAREAGVDLYHIGNNQIHRAIYEQALARPGVVVLHDAVLQHLFLGMNDERAYVNEFVYNYGEWNRGFALELWRNRAASALAPRYFEYPMLRRILERSRAAVVHNPAAAQMARRHAVAVPIIEIPHLFQRPGPVTVDEGVRFRQRLGIPSGAIVFGIFGYLRESKRLLSVLRAFACVRRGEPRAVFLVAGEFVSSDLARAATPHLRAPGVVRVPYLPGREFWIAAAAADACINLRSPASGETSGIAIRLMGIGKPVFVTSGLETARYPDVGCIRIEAGQGEVDSLVHHMFLVTSMADAANAIGRRGAGHIALEHSVEQAAEKYWKTLCEYRK
jgi:glycosyltransferase involved in cell wall biosynthesis